MSYNAKIICDSISETGKRLTTFEITFPRIVLAEFNTHRMLSRNSASSRAIPFKKQVERVMKHPFIPERFPIDGKGMQPNTYILLGDDYYESAVNNWLNARDTAVDCAEALYSCLDFDCIYNYEKDNKPHIAIHKQIVNRLLEPFMWHTVICTASEWDNFFKLRTHPDAQYEIKRIADLMYGQYHFYNSLEGLEDLLTKPKELKQGEWHLPFISDEDEILIDDFVSSNTRQLDEIINNFSVLASQEKWIEVAKRISVARCARVSYLTHDGKRDIEKDLELFERLRTSGHWSPFEHIATPYFYWFQKESFTSIRPNNFRSGNFIGWKQFRKEFQDENCTHFRKEQ